MTVCTLHGCPNPAVSGGRGRCAVHRLSEAERGYGREHRRDRAVNRAGASCESCGCTQNLQRDHRIPHSMGGGEEPANKRWLCACPDHRCHARVGVKTHAGGRFTRGEGGIETSTPSSTAQHLRPSFRGVQNPEIGHDGR